MNIKMEKVLVTVELTDNNYCAYLEKLPGCVSTGKTFDELKKNIAEAAAFHLAQRYVKRATTFDRLKIINKSPTCASVSFSTRAAASFSVEACNAIPRASCSNPSFRAP